MRLAILLSYFREACLLDFEIFCYDVVSELKKCGLELIVVVDSWLDIIILGVAVVVYSY